MASLTWGMVSSPKWNTLAASTASAPAFTAGAKCSTAPAPPLAMTGTDTAAPWATGGYVVIAAVTAFLMAYRMVLSSAARRRRPTVIPTPRSTGSEA